MEMRQPNVQFLCTRKRRIEKVVYRDGLKRIRGCGCREVPAHEIGRPVGGIVGNRCFELPAPQGPFKTHPTHQALHSASGRGNAFPIQLSPHLASP